MVNKNKIYSPKNQVVTKNGDDRNIKIFKDKVFFSCFSLKKLVYPNFAMINK